MSDSPGKIHTQIEYEVDRRILRESPTKNDLEYYLRKVSRLENQNNSSLDELAKAKIKLRRAEDFQIKFGLIFKQNAALTEELTNRDQQLFQLKEQNQYLKTHLYQKQNKGGDWQSERRNLQDQIDKYKARAEEAEDRRIQDVQETKDRCEEIIRKQNSIAKRNFAERQEDLLFQIRQLKKTLHEKETVEDIVLKKVAKVREEKDAEIDRLGKVIEKQKQDSLNIIRQKNQEFDKMREKFERMLNFELENLKKNQDDQDELLNIQLNGLREMITLKNDEISKLLNQMSTRTKQNNKQRNEFIRQISVLKDKIYIIERESQEELVNLKQRLTKIHSLDIANLESRYNGLVKTLREDKEQLQKLLKQKDRLVQAQKNQVERIKSQLLDRIKEREERILQLQNKLKDIGESNESQMKNLHLSLHKIESEREMMSGEYQNNVGFLNQQVAKLNGHNEVKNKEIQKLHDEIAHLKETYTQNLKDLQNKWKQERKDREQERERERTRRQTIEEDFRVKERDWKARERQLQREKQKEMREKSKLKYICEELQADINRQNQYIKQLDENLKNQYKKNQLSTLDTGGVRRELTGELDRQKNELESLKRVEVDQIRKKFEVEVSRLTNQNEKLQTDLLNKSIAFENLENQFKKLEYVNKNADKINKEKLVDYQKKMATLNNEINITQNLYQSFMTAKARSDKKENRKD